jgi:hypothetical protein
MTKSAYIKMVAAAVQIPKHGHAPPGLIRSQRIADCGRSRSGLQITRAFGQVVTRPDLRKSRHDKG